MGVKVLSNLINKNDVLSVINSIDRHLNEKSDNNSKAYLQIVRDAVEHLTPINIVEAGDINIVCENSESLEKYLKKHKE